MRVIEPTSPKVERHAWFGAYTALVTDVKDPDAQGRVKVRLPWALDNGSDSYEAWARLAVFMAGNNRGAWFIPDVDDEVLVVFEAGDPRRPCVIGAMWNGQDKPPESMDGSGNNHVKTLVSRSGIRIEMDDTPGQEKLTLKTPKQSIVLDDGGQSITITDASGNSIKLESSGISAQASAQIKADTGQMKVSAGMTTVDSGMTRCSGVVQSDTVITNSVVSASYTPGAGNIW